MAIFRIKSLLIAAILVLLGHSLAYAQSGDQSKLLAYTAQKDSLVRQLSAEKLYLQFDKPQYVTGDTIWFKAYLFNASSLFLSTQSGVLHVDIINDSNRVVKQYLMPVHNGLSWGDIALDEDNFTPGNYTLRAYTNWMRNFGNDAFYYKNIVVAGLNENNWLVQSAVRKPDENQSGTAVQLRLTDMNKKPVADSLIRVEVIEHNKTVYKQAVQTDKNGVVGVNFAMTSNAHSPELIIEDKSKHRRLVVPLKADDNGNVDLQFLPESGSLVAGLNTRVGFKAVGEDGLGKEVSGTIVNQNGTTVASFKSLYKGMGSFELQPKMGDSYTANVTLPDGAVKAYSFPGLKTKGTSLRVVNSTESDSVQVVLAATKDLAAAGGTYYFIAKVRGLICYAATLNFQQGEIWKSISKSLFPTGITHFILLTPQGQQLNERLIYIDRHDGLQLSIKYDKPEYFPKDSVALQLLVTDNAGQPALASLSMAVTDDAGVNTANYANDNIFTRLLLTSDLKGYVEEPGYYFSGTPGSQQALDNLLLTQGWVDYDAGKNALPFSAETEYSVSGKVTTGFGAPIKKTKVMLLSRLPTLLMDTVTDVAGKFTFDGFPDMDKPVFLLKAVNRKGKSDNVKITITQPEAPSPATIRWPGQTPWYVNSDSTLLHHINNSIALKKQAGHYAHGGHMLKEVVIKAKKTVKGSQNLNGPGNADQVIDEEEAEKAGKITWLQLLQQKVKGFRAASFSIPMTKPPPPDPIPPIDSYFIYSKMMIVIIDGELMPAGTYEEARIYLATHNAEDIRGVEVIYSGSNLDKYENKYGEPPRQWPPFCFVEITTREGNGPVLHDVPGMYLYKPLALSSPKYFYKPRYAVKDTSSASDSRSTIDWEPNITTDPNGKGMVSFYAADKPSTYTLIIEGTDVNGNIGFKRQKILINPKTTTSKSK